MRMTMRSTAARRATTPGRWPALLLAIAVNIAFIGVLFFSIRWQNRQAGAGDGGALRARPAQRDGRRATARATAARAALEPPPPVADAGARADRRPRPCQSPSRRSSSPIRALRTSRARRKAEEESARRRKLPSANARSARRRKPTSARPTRKSRTSRNALAEARDRQAREAAEH